MHTREVYELMFCFGRKHVSLLNQCQINQGRIRYKNAIMANTYFKLSSKIYHMHFVPMLLLILVIGGCFCEINENVTKEIKTVSTLPTPTTEFIHSTKSSIKPLQTTVPLNATQTTKKSLKTTKGYVSTEPTTTTRRATTQVYSKTKDLLKSARRQKLNTTSSALGNTIHTSTRLQDRLGAIDCDLPVLPRESRLWRGNETHELHLPVTVSFYYVLIIVLFFHIVIK